jgi:hypothetical protein
MAVVALSIDPYAADPAFPRRLARHLGLGLFDIAAFERDIAERLGGADGDLMRALGVSASLRAWRMTTVDLAARLKELTLEAALEGNVVINGWTATASLRPVAHVASVNLGASRQHRLAAAQRRMRYAHIGSAELDLDSEDGLYCDLLTQVFGRGWRRPEADLVIDTERASETTCFDLIARLTADARCVETPAAENAIQGRLLELR